MCVCGGGVVFVYFMQAKSEGFPVIFPLCLLTRSRGREGEGVDGRELSSTFFFCLAKKDIL